ncbi:MAG: phosphorylase [Methylococcales symbiont of Hymedesmia sp. n. MRB-2018]|nr:MAG: phosphorylase [Methylococcales symbiont of Hymedesmia sp. n. MRB-2018]KAF3983558.1 MAG: phosphorylase [Methylococcales symbiont of Hymedesmia sp. n. MRB-2018]
MITGIVIALADEVSSLSSTKIGKGDCVFINDKTLITCSGAGPKNAAKAAQLLIDKGAERLISWGCAAALKTGIDAGDLIIAQTLFAEDNDQISITSLWFQQVLEELSELKPLTGSLAESSHIVALSSAKKLIHKQNRAIALDMESIAVGKTAQKNDKDILVIRCIADPVTQDLPQAVCYALSQQGDIVLSKLLCFLLTHPQELPGLIRLGLNFNAAKNKLKLVAKHLDTIVSFEQQ